MLVAWLQKTLNEAVGNMTATSVFLHNFRSNHSRHQRIVSPLHHPNLELETTRFSCTIRPSSRAMPSSQGLPRSVAFLLRGSCAVNGVGGGRITTYTLGIIKKKTLAQTQDHQDLLPHSGEYYMPVRTRSSLCVTCNPS